MAEARWAGRVVLVTGGTRGIGRGVAEGFQAAGAQVVVCGRRPPDEALAAKAAFIPCDVRDPDAVAALIEQITARFGRLDVAVNNAGGAPYAEAATASPRLSESIIRLNLLAPLQVAQAANRIMQNQDTGGAIVNIASLSGTRPSPGTAAYGAAKAGLLNLTQTLAMEWAPKVRVNAIIAGLVATEAGDDHYGGPAGVARIAATVPMKRFGAPRDIAEAVLFLASPEAEYVTGAALAVHGGGERPIFLDLAAGA